MRKLLLLCCAVVLLTGCGTSIRKLTDPALLDLVPPDTVALVGIRMKATFDSPAFQRLFASETNSAFREMERETGLDLRKDVTDALIAIGPGGDEPLILVSGRFGDEVRSGRPGESREPYKSYTILGGPGNAHVFLNDRIVLGGGSADRIRSILDRRDRRELGAPKTLTELAGSIRGGSHAWAVAGDLAPVLSNLPPDARREINAVGNLSRLLSSVRSATAAYDLSRGVGAEVEITCGTEADATQIHDMLKGAITMARNFMPAEGQEVGQLLDGVKVEQRRKSVRVTSQIPLDLIEKIQAKAKSKRF